MGVSRGFHMPFPGLVGKHIREALNGLGGLFQQIVFFQIITVGAATKSIQTDDPKVGAAGIADADLPDAVLVSGVDAGIGLQVAARRDKDGQADAHCHIGATGLPGPGGGVLQIKPVGLFFGRHVRHMA